MSEQDSAPKRIPVNYRFDAINPVFLKWMARIGDYADEKTIRLIGEKSPSKWS